METLSVVLEIATTLLGVASVVSFILFIPFSLLGWALSDLTARTLLPYILQVFIYVFVLFMAIGMCFLSVGVFFGINFDGTFSRLAMFVVVGAAFGFVAFLMLFKIVSASRDGFGFRSVVVTGRIQVVKGMPIVPVGYNHVSVPHYKVRVMGENDDPGADGYEVNKGYITRSDLRKLEVGVWDPIFYRFEIEPETSEKQFRLTVLPYSKYLLSAEEVR
jgi:hypothetical protein